MKVCTTSIIIALFMAFGCGLEASALSYQPESTEQSELLQQEISIKVSGQNVRITKANGLKLEVYSITGTKISTTNIDSNDKTINLGLGRGWYILRVGTLTRKIAILS